MTIIVKTDPEDPSDESINTAAEIIREGGLVVFPTETVYGLGANAYSPEACLKIFRAKERPPDNPLIVHISDMKMLKEITKGVGNDLIRKLEKIWPGPVTILLPKSSKISDTVTGGSPLVAVRMPESNLTLSLIKKAGVPIAAPSANISTRPSITDSTDAIEELDGRVDLIFDCGLTLQGVESTIIDFTGDKCTLLRAGAKPVEDLEKIFGPIEVTDFSRGLMESTVPLAPGMKYRHYSPRKRMYLAASVETLLNISQLEKLNDDVIIIASDEACNKSKIRCIRLGSESNLDLVARNLFAALRELDKTDCKIGLIQPFTEKGKGLAIMNRIRKAASGTAESIDSIQELLH